MFADFLNLQNFFRVIKEKCAVEGRCMIISKVDLSIGANKVIRVRGILTMFLLRLVVTYSYFFFVNLKP